LRSWGLGRTFITLCLVALFEQMQMR
jgi:hypothetical protein